MALMHSVTIISAFDTLPLFSDTESSVSNILRISLIMFPLVFILAVPITPCFANLFIGSFAATDIMHIHLTF